MENGNWKLETRRSKPVFGERAAKPNKPNEAKGFDINRIRGKGEKQTQLCYPPSYQYVTEIFGPIFEKYECRRVYVPFPIWIKTIFMNEIGARKWRKQAQGPSVENTHPAPRYFATGAGLQRGVRHAEEGRGSAGCPAYG